MNKADIANLFIKAAFIDSRLPITAGPKRLKGSWFTGSALTETDQRKWFIREQGEQPSQIHKLDKGPMHDWWIAFWDGRSVDTSRNDVRIWELANEMMTLVADEANRRALWAWAMSKTGTLQANEKSTRKTSKKLGRQEIKVHKRTSKNVSFAAWCRAEGIHEMTGSRRKDRALAVLEQYLVRSELQNAEMYDFTLLPVGAVFEHISDNIAADAPSMKEPFAERDRDTVFCKDFTLAEWRKKIAADNRRRADLRRQQAA